MYLDSTMVWTVLNIMRKLVGVKMLLTELFALKHWIVDRMGLDKASNVAEILSAELAFYSFLSFASPA